MRLSAIVNRETGNDKAEYSQACIKRTCIKRSPSIKHSLVLEIKSLNYSELVLLFGPVLNDLFVQRDTRNAIKNDKYFNESILFPGI